MGSERGGDTLVPDAFCITRLEDRSVPITGAAREDARPRAATLIKLRLAMSKRALAIITAIMLFAGLVVLQVANSMKPRAAQVATLPDGSTLRLESVGYGKEHFRPGAWWHPLARRLPADWQRKLNVDSGPVLNTSEPSLGVWLNWEKSATSTANWWDFDEFGIADEHGVEAPVSRRSVHNSGSKGGIIQLGWAFTTFPRRGDTLSLRVYQRDLRGGLQRIAAFTLPNPARGKYPEWRPQPMPAMAKTGDLEIKFRQLLVGVGNGISVSPSGTTPHVLMPGQASRAFALLGITQQGASAVTWRPAGVEIEDATGNKVRPSSLSSSEDYLLMKPHLWPSEAAWKVRVEFMRNHEKAVFSTNELFVVTGLALPAADSVTELNLTTNRLGHTVRVLGLTHGKGKIGNRTSRMSGTGVRLEVDVSPALSPRKRLTIVKVRDDQGREAESRGFGHSDASYSFLYNPKADAKSLDFTLAVQEVVTAEFLVKPELFKPAPLAK